MKKLKDFKIKELIIENKSAITGGGSCGQPGHGQPGQSGPDGQCEGEITEKFRLEFWGPIWTLDWEDTGCC